MKELLGTEIEVINYSSGKMIFKGYVAQIAREKGITIKFLEQVFPSKELVELSCIIKGKKIPLDNINLFCLNKKEFIELGKNKNYFFVNHKYNKVFDLMVAMIKFGVYDSREFNKKIVKITRGLINEDLSATQMNCPFE